MRRYKRLWKNGNSSFILEGTQKYIQQKVQNWLCTAMEQGAHIDDNFFECLGSMQNGFKKTAQEFETHLANAQVRGISMRKKEELREEISSTSSKRYPSLFEDIWEEYPTLRTDFCEILFKNLNPKPVAMPQSIKKVRAHFREHLGCSEDMLDFLEFVFVLRSDKQVENYFEDVVEIHRRESLPLLATMLNMHKKVLLNVIMEAYTCGLLKDNLGEYFYATPLVDKLWYAESGDNLDDLIFKKFPEKSLPINAFHLPSEEKAHVLNLLSCQTEEPIHILLYGAAGTGKTSFAHSLATELGVKAWAVASREEDNEGDRRAALVACTRLAAKNQGSFVLLDEAERLLDTDTSTFFGNRGTKDKAWLNEFLEQKGRRIIWITNHIRHIDDAVRRRFAYSIHFEALDKKQRLFAWEQILQDEKVVSRINHHELQMLVNKYPVQVAVVSKAVRQTKLLQCKKGAFAKTVERILQAHMVLKRNGKKLKKTMLGNETYTLDGVTLERKGEHNITNIMRKMHKIDHILKQGSLPKGGGTMLFYGPPGTGKSALAQYMAQELGRECVIKKASDLLSMYVGEAEKNIAEAFERAEENGDILVIDEADSFIYSRESATASWEVTQVNEFLTQLESYRGICVCTSNRRTSMDMAAMRRFSFKIPFAYAGAEQIAKLYEAILSPLCAQELTEKQRKVLLSCKNLAPGDFAAVRSQFWLDDDTNHAKLIEALMREQKDKLDNAGKVLGFQ